MRLNRKIINIVFLIVILSSLTLLSYYSIKSRKIDSISNNKNLKYFRCEEKPLGTIINTIFINNRITKDNNNWDIYTPCGYNFVEKELILINIPNDNRVRYIFGINGCDNIVSKNNLWHILENNYGREGAKKIMPETYILDDMNQMRLFKSEFNPNNIYILKKNLQRKEGLKLSNSIYEINTAYNDNYKVVQKYIRNLYLINGYKINLRIYLLITINNNKKSFYLSNLGKCIYTAKKYNDDDYDFETNITSYNLDMNIYKINPRTLNELSEYLDKQQNNSNILFKNIRNILYKVALSSEENVYQSTNLNKKNCHSFQIFGVDIIFDKLLNAYLLEINKGPDMKERDPLDYAMKYKIQSDMLNIVGILKDTPQSENSFKLI